jgi:Ca2+-binding EF-hand superfamily protein
MTAHMATAKFVGFLLMAAMCSAQDDVARMEDDAEQLGFNDHDNLGIDPTHEETIKLTVKHFNEIDVNSDGKIDYNEINTRFHAHMGSHFKKLAQDNEARKRTDFSEADRNGDGMLDKEEHSRNHGQADQVYNNFDFFDDNADGKLAFDE